MTTYGEGFARVYNRLWAAFARQVAPRILDFYGSTAIGQENQAILDLCCGTGQFATEALNRGYTVVGLDLSPHMLHHARENNRSFIESGRARFVQADARDFSLDERFGLAVSTYDALNHLETEVDLARCFARVFSVVQEGGYFIFDLNTPARLRRWTGINVTDEEEMMLVSRALYVEPSRRAFMKISGFVRRPDGLYERFDETLFNTAFEPAAVRELVLQAGWKQVHLARVQDLATPVPEPEQEDRIFFVAHK